MQGPKNSKIINIFKNFGTSLVKALCTSLLGFLITPYVINYVGDETYGIYKLIFDWLSNVWMFDLGVSGSFLVTSALYLNKSDPNEIYGDGLKAHLRILPLLFLASLAFYFLVFNLVKLDQVTFLEYSIGFWIVAATFIVFPLNIFRQYFEVSERMSLLDVITIKQLFLTNVFTLVFAYMGLGLIGICTVYSFFVIGSYLYVYYIAKKERKWNLKKLLQSKGQYSKEINTTGRNYLFINISQKISFLADNTIIAYFYSPAQIIPFFISQRLAALFQGQIQGLGYTGWASLIEFYNSGDVETFKNKLKEVLKFNLIISSVVFLIIWLMNEKFISLWIGDKYFIDNQFNILVSLLMITNILNFLIGSVLNGTGHMKSQSNAYILLGVLNLGLSIGLTKFYGFHGPIFASLLTMGMLFIYKIQLLLRVYSFKGFELIKIFIPQITVVALMIFISSQYLDKVYSKSWINLFLYSGLIASIYLLVSFFLFFSKDEKRIWKNRFMKVYKHFR